MRALRALHPRLEWFTPTRVGNAASGNGALTAASVHPHACGECDALKLVEKMQDGSPPRVWGMRLSALRKMLMTWFTPTRVGNAGAGMD